MVTALPPAYAWDWFSRQRLLWREARTRLIAAPSPAGGRYVDVDARPDVVSLLRSDYPDEAIVREIVDGVVRELAFLDRTDASFHDLGVRMPPRGMRWWWEHLTGEAVGAPPTAADRRAAADARAQRQLSLEDVLGGYGDQN